MKIINDVFFIEWRECIECGIKENTLKSLSQRKPHNFINDPSDNRKKLVAYEPLNEQQKQQIHLRFGNPYDYFAKQPIKKLIEKDFKAEAFYMQYKFDGEKTLSIEHVNKYTTAANWLNMLIKADTDKQFIKKALGLTIDKFYLHVSELIKKEDIDLPTSYHRLRAKMDEYKTQSYQCLINWKFGNKLAAKLGKTEHGFNEDVLNEQVSLIRFAASKHNNFDAMRITSAVNQVFVANGWPEVSHGTVYNVVKSNEHLTTPGRRGARVYNATMAMQVKRKRPTLPLRFFSLDGWTVELLYQGNNSKGQWAYDNRLVVVVVLDVMNNYPIGYAIGDRENIDLIKQANRNALLHIEELFGQPYRPAQLQSDHYGIKTLTPFYDSMTKFFVPAAVGNAKAKPVEPYFNYLNTTYCQLHPNWSGHNVTASAKNQVNVEMLDKLKKTFPSKKEVVAIIHNAMQQERKIKIDAYMQAWQQLNEADKKILEFTRMDALMIFGKPTGFLNSITGQGLTPTIEGEKKAYDSFDPRFRALQNLSWQVIYDAADTSKILAISEDSKHKFLLHEKRVLPMAITDMEKEDHAYLSTIRQFNKERREEIMQVYADDAVVVEKLINNTPLALNDADEASLKLMFTYAGQQKETLQDAKGLKQIAAPKQDELFYTEQEKYLNSKVEFNQYAD